MEAISIVGIGPGAEEMMTGEAVRALEEAEVLVGYTGYLELLGERFQDKKWLSTPMTQEVERCRMCFREAVAGWRVAMISSGDAGIYGMASLMFEIAEEFVPKGQGVEIRVIPGVTAANAGAAILGAPLNHDFCVISLSDLLTPWEQIEQRLRAAAAGDFVIAIYNPSSRKRRDHLRRACGILLETIEPERPCGYVRLIGRKGTESAVLTLDALSRAETDMFTTVYIGNSRTRILDGRLVTPRGYQR